MDQLRLLNEYLISETQKVGFWLFCSTSDGWHPFLKAQNRERVLTLRDTWTGKLPQLLESGQPVSSLETHKILFIQGGNYIPIS